MLYFILGILFYMAIVSILENIVELICSYIEVAKGKNTLKIVEMNEVIQNEEEYTDTNVMGFQYTPHSEDDEYEEYEE